MLRSGNFAGYMGSVVNDVETGFFVEGLKVLSEAITDDEVKFDMSFQLEVNGVLQTSPIYTIDPKIKIRDVIMPTSIKSNTAEFSIVDKKVLLRIEKSKTMAMFMKLLATKIVANKRLGFFNNLITLVTSILFSVSLVLFM